MSAASGRHRQRSLDRGPGGVATFQPRRDNLVGHLDAYFEEGLACELLIATADALRRALPRNLEGLGLAQLRAYKHVQGGSGTDLHADMGAVSGRLSRGAVTRSR